MRSTRWILVLFVLALVAGPVAADCDGSGKSHDHAATEAKACCSGAAEGTGCSAECPHAQEALRLAKAAENGDHEAMDKLVAMVKESGHEDAITLAGNAGGGCSASQAALIAMVKEHVGGEPAMQAVNMTSMAESAGKGCAKSTAGLIAAAKKSDDPKMVDLASKAEGGCEHSKTELIAMVTEQSNSDTE